MAKPCGARTRNGRCCRAVIADDQKRCRMHGGASPQALAAVARRRAEAAAASALETYGRPVDTNPVDALLNEVKWTAGHVEWLRQRVQELETDALTWGVTTEVEKAATEFPGTDVTRSAEINAWLGLYQRERTHLVTVCKAAIAAGLAERQVKLAEAQGALLASVIRAILDDLNLTAEQAARVPEIVPRRLRAVASAA